VAATLLVSASGGHAKPIGNGTPTTPAESGTPTQHTEYATAIAEVRTYLDLWVKQGPAAAAASFLVPDEQLPSDAAPVPAPVTATVPTWQPQSWVSADDFTLLVTLKLHFVGPPPGNWAEGDSARFVRFTRSGAGSTYRMYVATGP
jgi:hypothetical protein